MKITTRIFVLMVLTGFMYLLPIHSSNLLAQRNGKGNGTCQAQNSQNCTQTIPGLTEIQKQKISDLNTAHQNEMKLLRDEKRNTKSIDEKNEIDEKMTAKIDKHKADVKAILTPEQQKNFDENYSQNRHEQRSKNCNTGNGNGNGKGNGNGNGTCRRNR